jgi:thermostable 8-oxoguanine DNA glycosylase
MVSWRFLTGRRIILNREAKRENLVYSLRHITPEMREHLRSLKEWGTEESKRSDFVWHILLQSFATWGAARGAEGLINNPNNYSRVTFERLSKHYPKKRYETLQKVFRKAGIRWPETKAVLMARNYDLVRNMGGLAEARKRALASRGREAKISFMKRFHGIGDKYARNIWMDVYHRDFHDAIAVDERIKKITKALGYSFKPTEYDKHERFYQEIAKEAGLQGWELDRLLFNYTNHFQSVIGDK